MSKEEAWTSGMVPIVSSGVHAEDPIVDVAKSSCANSCLSCGERSRIEARRAMAAAPLCQELYVPACDPIATRMGLFPELTNQPGEGDGGIASCCVKPARPASVGPETFRLGRVPSPDCQRLVTETATLSGSPVASTSRWYLLPHLPRSVGLAPIRSPPFSPGR